MPPIAANSARTPFLSDRQGFDRRWFAPALEAVYAPTRVDEVADAVRDAIVRFGRDVRIVSGRHCYENFVYGAETRAVIDMSGLNQAGYERERGLYFVDAGCENWTVYRTLLNGFGRTLPAGSCYSVGAGGHITGGGYGLLSRLHGLTVDHLQAVDIVTWDAARGEARLRHVAADSADADERDLFWALCGAGGGNFGAIVRYYFAELPEAPQSATLWTLAWNWSDMPLSAFRSLLAEYAEAMAVLPDNAFTLLKLNHAALGQLGMVVQIASGRGVGHREHCLEAERHVERLQARFSRVAPVSPLLKPFGGHPGRMHALPASEQAQHLTYLEALQTLNGSGPNQFGKYKSAYMKQAFPIEQVDAIHHWLQVVPEGVQAADMAQSLLQVDSYGGAINRRASDATAVPQRSSIMKLQYQTYWNNDSAPGQSDRPPYSTQAEAHVGWIDRMYRDVYAAYGGTPDPARDRQGVVDGCYYNYPDSALGTHADGGIDHALRLYFLDNYRDAPRNLLAIKRRWDPTDVFHHPQSIPVR
jgi:FAD/FMN-containing dehydrogenase